MNRHAFALYLFLITLALGSNLAYSATITWTNTSGGNWSIAANWSPHQVPTNADNVLITTPGTYTVALDVGSPYYNSSTNVSNLTLGAGGGAAGLQTFLVTNLIAPSAFFVNSLLLVTNGGVLDMTNGYLAANSLTIANGGVFNGKGENLIVVSAIVDGGVFNTANGSLAYSIPLSGSRPSMIVTNGGVLNANGDTLGSVTVANGGLCVANGVSLTAPYLGYSFTVAHGGAMNITNGLTLYSPLINSGTINLTNTWITVENYYAAGHQYGYGGLVNQPGGLIHFQGSGSISGRHDVYQSVPYDYFFNQGILTQSGGTNTIDCQVMDNTQGTITNLSGTLVLGTYQTNLAGIYYAAAGATIQLNAVNVGTNFVTAGTPLVLAGTGQYQMISGNLYYPSNAIPNLALLGTTLKLGPGFQGGTITNLALDGIRLSNSLPVSGLFAVTNSSIGGNFTVASGGVFNGTNASTYGTLTVASGGLFIANGGGVNEMLTLGGTSFNGSLTVAHGGVVNLAGNFGIYAPLTNAGTVNISNAVINVDYGPFYGKFGGIVNQSGGLMNLGNNVGIYFATPNGSLVTNAYFINQGMLVQMPGTATTNTISCPASAQVGNQQISINLAFNFDNTQGTITNFSGTLALPGFRTNLAGTFSAAAGATIQLGGGTAATPLTPGTPLMLSGNGQYQFFSGYLYLPANVPPNLSLLAGLLELGPGFQGGAITNLVLDGIALTNQLSTTLPVKGTFTVLNTIGGLNDLLWVGWGGFYGTGVYGDYTVASGGALTVSNSLMRGSVTVANGGVFNDGATVNGAVTVAGGGVLNANGANLHGSVTVATGGVLNSTGADMDGKATVMYGSATVASGGVLSILPGSFLLVYAPLTNSGTINLTNSSMGIYNYGTTYNYIQGSLINQADGLINILDNTGVGEYGSSIRGGGGYDYLVNQGRIIYGAGLGFVGLLESFTTNSGTISALTGPIVMEGQWTLLSSSSLNVGLNSAANYGRFIMTTNYPSLAGHAGLTGAFNVTLNNGYLPTNGTTFNVLSYGSLTGSFTSLGLPSAVSWQSNYGSTNFTLVAGSAKPQFGTFNLSGTNLIFSGIGGLPGSNYVVLVSTNLTLPLANWSALTTNTFDGSGQFHYTNPVSPAKPRQFFIFKLP